MSIPEVDPRKFHTESSEDLTSRRDAMIKQYNESQDPAFRTAWSRHIRAISEILRLRPSR